MLLLNIIPMMLEQALSGLIMFSVEVWRTDWWIVYITDLENTTVTILKMLVLPALHKVAKHSSLGQYLLSYEASVHVVSHCLNFAALCFLYAVSVTLSVRVQGGTQPYNGRAEVMYNGEWGTICNMGWGLNDARAFCRQLGYVDVTATGLVSDYSYAAGSGHIWQTNVDCTGQERRFGDCAFTGTWGDTASCNHSMDVAVQCSC